MFSTTGLFKNIPCPDADRCEITSCIFSHASSTPASGELASPAALEDARNGHATKRRKLEYGSDGLSPGPATASQVHQNAKDAIYSGPSKPAMVSRAANSSLSTTQSKPPVTLEKAVTPPPLQKGPKKTATPRSLPAKIVAKEVLHPRRLAFDPVGVGRRIVILKYLHAEMQRLNEIVKKGNHQDKEVLKLSDDELVKAALDEEEETARTNSKVYANVIKNRIAAYKKMNADDWIKHVLSTFRVSSVAEESTKDIKPLETGLTPEQECQFLDHMICDQSNLAVHGYVTSPPTDAEITEAKAVVAASANYEVCDSCKSRFRVFPDRREVDGALTTNGPCVYHWGRPVYPKREKTDAIKGSRETVYGCCGENLGTKGCTERETHVFKVNDPKRLASLLPFINTPKNEKPAKASNGRVPAALTFDCEMGYTVSGFEVMRLTAVTWPEGDPCIDVLVRPYGAILDFNTRFSGISSEAYHSAKPYQSSNDLDSLMPPPPPGGAISSGPLPIVDSPAAARDLLCSYITPSTPLIGHALENDLNVVRLCHPRIIDTVLLFPHPKGLPIRYGLRVLTKQRLGRDIQAAGANGHDSMEDARATGELVRFAVKKRWDELRREGFTFHGGELMPPLPPTSGEAGPKVLGGGAGTKRQRIELSGERDGGVTKKANMAA